MRILYLLPIVLLVPNVVFALTLLYPFPSEQPNPSQPPVPVDSCFQWSRVLGVEKYILDIQPFDESIDNISPSRCYDNLPPDPSNPNCPSGSNLCVFPFLDLPAGRNIQYASSYTWSVTALNAVGNPVGGPSGSRTFTTELLVGPPPPPGDGDGGGDAGGGGTGTLKNPISAKNLTDLFNQIFSFSFGLAIFIVPVVVIYAAFLILMGGGDPVKLAKGRMILLWTAVAFIIILLARGLPVVFKNLL